MRARHEGTRGQRRPNREPGTMMGRYDLRRVNRILAMPEEQIFLQKDLSILKGHFDIRTVRSSPKGMKLIDTMLIIFRILKGTLWADLTFVWFAGRAALIAVLFSKILGKKSIVIVGGYEVCNVPELVGYGAIKNPLRAKATRFVLKYADRVLTVDESLKDDAIKNFKVSGKNIRTVPTGYDPEVWEPNGKKEDLVISVGGEGTVQRKGLDTFVKAAKYLPDVKFVLVGGYSAKSMNYLRSLASPNVEFPGFIPNEELPQWYGRAKVYCQLSRYEGLPTALCEAMLCECVPVGTNYCGIPRAIGDAGFYIPYGDVEATVEATRKALNCDKAKEARKRIKDMFSLERRERELMTEINELLGA